MFVCLLQEVLRTFPFVAPRLVIYNIYICYYSYWEICWYNYYCSISWYLKFWYKSSSFSEYFKECIGMVVFCIRDYISRIRIRSILINIFGNFGLYWGVLEGRNMSKTYIYIYNIHVYQNLKKLSWTYTYEVSYI